LRSNIQRPRGTAPSSPCYAEPVGGYTADVLGFETGNFLGGGSNWQVVRQPAWVATVLAQPADGTFA